MWLSVTAEEAQDYERLAEKDVFLDWLQVYHPEADFQGGIFLRLSSMVSDTADRRNIGKQSCWMFTAQSGTYDRIHGMVEGVRTFGWT